MHVAVVGGGIIGLAVSDALARAGTAVTCFERRTVGSGSTERANGGIRGQFSTEANVKLSRFSLDVWDAFEARYGIDMQFRRNGYLFLTDDADTAARFRANVEMQNEHGIPSRYLAPEAVPDYSPGINTASIAGATYSPSDGYADPHLALRGFLDRARAAGTAVEQHTPVADIERISDSYVVEHAEGHTAADAVVVAAGPWTGHLLERFGHRLPIRPIRRQLALLEPDRPLPADHPYAYHVDRKVSFRPERHPDALVSGGYPGATSPVSDPGSYRRSVDTSFAVDTAERLGEWAAYFGPDTRIKGGWAGLYTVTPDKNPIIDELEPGLVVATGFSGHGFMHAPAVGRVVAELVLPDRDPFVSLSDFRHDRFTTAEGLGDGDGDGDGDEGGGGDGDCGSGEALTP